MLSLTIMTERVLGLGMHASVKIMVIIADTYMHHREMSVPQQSKGLTPLTPSWNDSYVIKATY